MDLVNVTFISSVTQSYHKDFTKLKGKCPFDFSLLLKTNNRRVHLVWTRTYNGLVHKVGGEE